MIYSMHWIPGDECDPQKMKSHILLWWILAGIVWIGGIRAQTTVNLVQELQQTKFTQVACEPLTNSIVANVQNGIVSQNQTQFQYSATCGNGGLLFNPSSSTIAAGISAQINGTLFPQGGGRTIIGQVCSMSLLAILETVDTVTGTIVTSQVVAQNLQFSCDDVQVDEDCSWIDLACFWSQGETTSSSAFWIWVCLFSIAVIFAIYYLGFRLPWASAESAKSRKQYSYLEKQDAEELRMHDMQAETLATEVTSGNAEMKTLEEKKQRIDQELGKPENRQYVENLERQQAFTGLQAQAYQTPSGWNLQFSMPSAMTTAWGSPAAPPMAGSREDSGIRLRSRRPEFDMVDPDAEYGHGSGSEAIEMHPLMERYGSRFAGENV
jgi:hypothetical protein